MIRRQKKKNLFLLLIVLIYFLSPAYGAGQCRGHFINPISDICWRCFFPLTIGSVKVMGGHRPDTSNPGNPVCLCWDGIFPKFGLAVGFWEPAALIDVTRHPYCMVNMGGWQLPKFKNVGEGAVDNYSSSNNHSFYYFHYIKFPMMSWFPVISGGACHENGEFGIGYLSELDPAWHDEKLNNVLYPEMKPVIAHILAAQVAQTVDCVASTAHLPIDQFYWSAGCQGSLYPLEGEVQEHVDSVQASTLLSERAILKLHRLGFMQDSDKNSLCHEHYTYYLPKSRYRYQMIYPKAASDCYPFGHSTATWASGMVSSASSEDFGYLIWKKRNCCAY